MHDESDHQGLARDLATLDEKRALRRQILHFGLGAGLVSLVGCKSSASSSGACSTIPEETAGPYPGDGSNGPNALSLASIVRSDIRSSIDGASGTAEGVPLTLELTIANGDGTCASLAGYAVYLWHCDREGQYSMYSNDIADENYLRGVQVSDSDGTVTFTTIFPGCYSGRWPHIHFEVYPSLADAAAASNMVATSQLALPQDACDKAYAADGYSASVANFESSSLDDDNVFADDGGASQIPAITGGLSEGFVATITIPVDV